MTVWFNDPQEGSLFAKVGPLVDAEAVNTKIDFSEAIFRKSADGKIIDCFLYATAVSDVKKAKEQNWVFSPAALHFQLHNEKYEKWGANKSKTEVEPSNFTKFLFQFLFTRITEKDTGTSTAGWMETPEGILCAKGSFLFSEPAGSVTAKAIMDGKDANGKVLAEPTLDFLTSQYITLEPIEALEHLKLEGLPEGGRKGGNWGGSKGQTEAEKLRDRLAFLLEQTSQFTSGANNLSELAVCMQALQKDNDLLYHELNHLVSVVMK